MTTPGFEVVVVLRAPRVSDAGNDVADWSDWGLVVKTPITGCDVQPGASAEDLDHREAQNIAFTVLMPSTPASKSITGDDRLLVRGHHCPVNGDPEDWSDPDPWVSHIKVLVDSWRDLA